eukprot:COSAG01_NODE_2186_length_8202_cov_5.667407_4_plen_53_part_00
MGLFDCSYLLPPSLLSAALLVSSTHMIDLRRRLAASHKSDLSRDAGLKQSLE